MSSPLLRAPALIRLAALLALVLSAACSAPSASGPAQAASGSDNAADIQRPLPLVPLPEKVERGEGHFTVTASTRLTAGDATQAHAAATAFADMLRESTGISLQVAAQEGDGGISFAIDPDAPEGDEAYRLEVTADGVRARARSEAGLFYAGVTLWQLATGHPAEAGQDSVLPVVRIEDAPRFSWRGFMLDSARHIQGVDDIKRLLDQMARHKLNVFHWHLTDDQGWRLEIKRYPKLTDVGAWRVPAGKAGQGADGKPVRYGGFYTQAQAREIVAYAAKLHIRVVPEIELPGHAQAAIASYPELGVTGQAPPVSPDWGVHTWLFNPEDSTFTFLTNVLTEVMDVFPGTYIHIGGDEADEYQWRNSPNVQARRKALGLKSDTEMRSWFVKRIESFLVANKRRLIGWDEILEGGLPPEATVMSWRGIKGAIEAARSGHDVVLTPSNITYLNRMQSEEADEPPGHDYPTPLKAVYDFDPVPTELDAQQARHVLGTQGNVWTEHIRTSKRVEHMAFPRLSALSEVAWSPKDARDWTGFLARLAPQMQRFDKAGIGAADSAFAARFDVQPQAGKVQVTLANQAAFGALRYTIDGQAPTADSPQYSKPLVLPLGTTVTANAYLDGQPLAKPRTLRVDADTLRSRDAEKLSSCRKDGLVLRLEDDEPLEGARVAVPVDIGKPCWLWRQAPLDGIARLRADVVDLPFNFQFGADSMGEPPPPAPARVVLQVLAADCKTPIASAPVPVTAAVIETVDVALPAAQGAQDLCLKFDGDHRRVLWAIDRVALLPQASSP